MLKKLKNIVKNALAITWVRRLVTGFNRTVLEFFGSNRVFGTIYAFFSFITFNREEFAVVRGRRNYYRNLNKDRATHVELRRNVHRLEKGILMQPRKDSFASDYIGETVEFYRQAVVQCGADKDSMDSGELQWAHDVLKEYFGIVKPAGKIAAAKKEYESIDYSVNSLNKVPYEREVTKISNVQYDDLLDLAVQRRSVRWFQDKPVPRELIDKALLVARQAPTACNRMPYQFKIYDDPELAKKVSNIPFGTGGYADNIPTIVVIVGKLDSYFSPRDRHAIYVDSSLASMSFALALETLGLSSCMINWPDFEPLEARMQKTLGLGYEERVIMLMAVGYADPKGMIAHSEKKSLDVIRTYNEPIKK